MANTRGELPVAPSVTRSRITSAEILDRYGLLIAFFAVVVVFGILRPDTFLSWRTVGSILGSQAVLVILTVGLLISMRVGDPDLSVASLMALSAMTVAVLNARQGVPILLAILVALAIGALVGLFNGYLAVRFGIDSFVITIGSATVMNGVIFWISKSLTIAGISNWLVDWVILNRLLGIPLSFWYGLLITTGVWLYFEHTGTGLRSQFVGRSRDVAQLSGVQVRRIRLFNAVLTSLVAAIAGVLYAGTTGSADPSSGQTFLLPAFAGCFLGATAIRPGQFNAWGSFAAVYFLVTGMTGLAIYGVASWVQPIFYGGALLVSVTISRLSKRRTEQQSLMSM